LEFDIYSLDFNSINKMKKLIFGALALALMIVVVSCRNENPETTEESVEETIEVNLEMAQPVEDSIQVETETPADSLQTPVTEVEQETPAE